MYFQRREKTDYLQSGTNRIIQEMAAVCTSIAKILLQTQWTQVTVFCAFAEIMAQ